MHKYESYIHEFLLQNKAISLERIGSFSLENDNVSFLFSRKAETDPQFIQYVAEQLHKNVVLVGTNIESHLEQARQFINIGKPYTIPGVGTVAITKTGEYSFEPQFSAVSSDASEEEFIPVSEPAERERKKKTLLWLAILAVLIVVGAGGYGIYTWLGKNRSEEPIAENKVPEQEKETEVPIDSVSKKPDSVATLTPLSPDDSTVFHFVIERTFNPYRAHRRTAHLQELKININLDSAKVGDSTLYKLYFIKRAAPKDTARINDSLRNWYSAKRVVAERAQ